MSMRRSTFYDFTQGGVVLRILDFTRIIRGRWYINQYVLEGFSLEQLFICLLMYPNIPNQRIMFSCSILHNFSLNCRTLEQFIKCTGPLNDTPNSAHPIRMRTVLQPRHLIPVSCLCSIFHYIKHIFHYLYFFSKT